MNSMMQRIELNEDNTSTMNTMIQRIELNKETTMNTMMQRIELFDTKARLVGMSSDSDTESESESKSETLTGSYDVGNESFAFGTVTPPRRQNSRKRRSCIGRIEASSFRPMMPTPKRLCRSPKVGLQGNLSKWRENLKPAKEVTTRAPILEVDTSADLSRMESWWFKARLMRGESFDDNSSGSGSNFWDEVDAMVVDSERDATAILNEDYEHYIANISACSY